MSGTVMRKPGEPSTRAFGSVPDPWRLCYGSTRTYRSADG
jgi:hypothetical protein